MFKCKKEDSSLYPTFHSLLRPKPANKYNIQSRGKLTEPFYRKECAQFNIEYCGPHLCNELTHYNFHTLASLPLFCMKIKEFILCLIIQNNTSIFSNFN